MRVVTVIAAYDRGDREEFLQLGKFATLDEGIAMGREHVDRDLRKHYRSGVTGRELYRLYLQSSADVSVDAAIGVPVFYGWKYAKQRCLQMCGMW